MAQADSFVRGTPRFRQAEGVSYVMGYFLRGWVPYVDAPLRVALEPRIRKVAEEVVWEDDDEGARSWMMVDWFCRACAPAWLRAAGFAAEAAAIEATAAIVDGDSADDALLSVEAAEAEIEARGEPWCYRRATRDRGKAAWRGLVAAADDAVQACGGEAAYGAGEWGWNAYPYIYDPASWAIENAAWTVAAQAVPWDVRDECYDAPTMSWAMVKNASAALRPTVIALRQSALDLLDRMIAAGGT